MQPNRDVERKGKHPLLLTPIAMASLISLPSDILHTVLDKLDKPPPSALAIYFKPGFDTTSFSNITLKALSCISKAWRAVVLDRLFSHARIIIGARNYPRHCTLQSRLVQAVFRFEAAISINNLKDSVKTLTIVIEDSPVLDDRSFSKPEFVGRDFDPFIDCKEADQLQSCLNVLWHSVQPLCLTIVVGSHNLSALTRTAAYLKRPRHYIRSYKTILLTRPATPRDTQASARRSCRTIFSMSP